MIDIAYAAGGIPGGGAAGGFQALIPLLLMFAVFYFLLIRPQQKNQRQHREMLQSLKKGDHIVTAGGIHGTVEALTDTIVKVKIADNVKVDVSRSSIAGKVE
ncbi:MAG: preprotein translocase subunit YajC [candidate division NC10 bacterium]|nr:preprotein translocase subunit YajC [candidate division NC10 bacterium]